MKKTVQYRFERYEKKYFITPQQQEYLLFLMQSYIKADEFQNYPICNIYYDTDNWQLIRASIDKPVYKEKLRVRSYGVPKKDDEVYIELKKKYMGIVYKRRISTEASLSESYLKNRIPSQPYGQIG